MTRDEQRARFLEGIRECVNFWATDPRPESVRARLDGLVHSILATLDGEGSTLPGYFVEPVDSDSLEQLSSEHDIAGDLHNLWGKEWTGSPPKSPPTRLGSES